MSSWHKLPHCNCWTAKQKQTLSYNMSILKYVSYFKPKHAFSSLEGPLLCEGLLLCEGSLSHEVPSSSIQAANKSVIVIFESEVEIKSMNEKRILQKSKYKVNIRR